MKTVIYLLLLSNLLTLSSFALEKPNQPYSPQLLDDFTQQLKRLIRSSRTDSAIKNSQFIIGGIKVEGNLFDQVVSLTDQNGQHFCTGTLVTDDTIVTAGHCIYYFENPNSNAYSLLRQWNTKQDGWTLKENIETYLERINLQRQSEINITVANVKYRGKITSIIVDPSWRALNSEFMQYYLISNAKKPKAFSFNDRAIIRLSKKITHVKKIPMINNSELDYLMTQLAKNPTQPLTGLQIGFGLTTDPNKLKRKLADDYLFQQQLKKISGIKYQVELPLVKFWRINNYYRASIGTAGKAACYGDSGGPTFIKLKNIGWRLLASLSSGVKGAFCGEANPVFWANNETDLVKNSTDIVDIWSN